ncbi:histidine phosphatase family protein [Parazoarcus communis]|uniref:Histidine phosphatase family protein n=1 Tax=Parazoarcus communis TaxID=41977 RepID=A0A2U8GZA0_9RHOO|nr:histidine phosphatase family protein [Parazoarcus communis]AWI77775.1 histidine phosphatase family protein [Parazoarcus communis]
MRNLMTCLLLLFSTGAIADDESLWAALRAGGHVALMRHAPAPGIGDPAGFVLGDCSTQRNLSPAGRAQAATTGERLRAQGITRATIHSSRWCRCLDTARLLGLGPVIPTPALDSFFNERDHAAERSAAVRALVRDADTAAGPLILVTHQVNITALSGVYPASGELVVMRIAGDALELAGRIQPLP